MNSKFFSSNLAESDPEIANAIEMEFKRQQNSIELKHRKYS
jgi:hypothetical protein